MAESRNIPPLAPDCDCIDASGTTAFGILACTTPVMKGGKMIGEMPTMGMVALTIDPDYDVMDYGDDDDDAAE